MNKDEVEVVVSGSMIKWYTDKGYEIPTHTTQLWATVKGVKVKNGKKTRVAMGTKIIVKLEDLAPSSNTLLSLMCNECLKPFTTTYKAYKAKHLSDRCTDCAKKTVKDKGSNSYWKKH